MKIAYLRQGPISFDSTFGYEHTRIGLASAMVELGHSFAFFNVFDEDWKTRWTLWNPACIYQIKTINSCKAQRKWLKDCDLLIVEQAERALPRFWTNPGEGGKVSSNNIEMTWLYRFWWTLGQYEGPVLLIYNDPKCRAQLLPESIALRYLEGRPIAPWTSSNKSLIVVTEANAVSSLMMHDAAWNNNTDMSAGGFGIPGFSANLSTIFFPRAMRHRMGSKYGVPVVDKAEFSNRKYDMVYFGKPKNQRPQELYRIAANRKTLCIGGWEEAKAKLEKKFRCSLDNWTCVDTIKGRVSLDLAIQQARYCACPGDDFYYAFHSLTARPFEGIVNGSVPVISARFHSAAVDNDEYMTSDVQTKFPKELLHHGNCDQPLPVPDIDTLASVLAFDSKAVALAQRLVRIGTSGVTHSGSLSEAYRRYLLLRFSEKKLKSFPMAQQDIDRAFVHAKHYGVEL